MYTNWHVLYPVGPYPLLDLTNTKVNWNWNYNKVCRPWTYLNRWMLKSHYFVKLLMLWYSVSYTEVISTVIMVFFTNLMHKFLILIHLLHPSTCFKHYCAHPQEVVLYNYNIWACHSLLGDCSVRSSLLNLCTEQSPKESDRSRCCNYTVRPPEDEHSSARNM